MKKIFTLLLGLYFGGCAIAQIAPAKNTDPVSILDLYEANNKDLRPVNDKVKGLKSLNSPLGISAEITAVYNYIAGATMDIKFSITIVSDDWEYGDFLSMTFPAGITPLSGSDPIIIADGEESLNGVDGQTISWGDNDNDWGGMPVGTFDFFVTVTVDKGLTGTKSGTFYLSGDEYGDPPHAYNGTFSIAPLPDFPDLALGLTGFLKEYYSVPLDQVKTLSQVSSPVQVIAINLGDTLKEATNVEVVSSFGYSDSKSVNLPLNPYQEQLVEFNPFAISETGNKTFHFTVSAPGDPVSTNDNAAASITVSNTDLIRDNGDIQQFLGIGTGGGDYLGSVFTILAQDTLNSVTVYMGEITKGDIISVDVFRYDDVEGVKEMVASSIEVALIEPDKEYTVFFTGQGVVLEPGKYLFAVKEGENLMLLGYTSDEFTPNSAWVSLYGYWLNMSTEFGMDYTFYIRPGFGTTLPAFDMEVYSVNIDKYVVKGDEVIVRGELLNKGVDPLTAVNISYSVNNATPVTETISGISSYGLIDYEFSTTLNTDQVGNYNIKIYLSEPNGGNDADQTNDTLTTILSAVEYAPSRRVVGEEGTGTWCGWCPRGHVNMGYMDEKYPDTWIGIAVHNYDPMVVDAYDEGLSARISGYPGGLVNRTSDDYDPAEFESVYLEQISKVSPVDLVLDILSYDGSTRKVTFKVTANFLAQVAEARFNAVIVENNVTGTTSDYDQANFYSDGTYGEMGGYENLPHPVPAANMVYENVARGVLGRWDGNIGSIPENITAGSSVSYSYSVTLDKSWEAGEIYLVAMVIDQNSGEILNTARNKLFGTGILPSESFMDIKVYPNPFSDLVTLANIGNVASIKVTNVLGSEILTVVPSATEYQFSTSNLAKGVYFITLTDYSNSRRTICVIKQ